MKVNTAIFKNAKPVLILKGYDIGTADVGQYITQQFTTEVDRGQLKTIDLMITAQVSNAVTDLGNFTLSVGGQNVMENLGFANYGVTNINAFRYSQVKTFAQENQTLGVIFDARLSTTRIRYFQLLATYTTEAHELFLRQWSTEYLPGYKRKGYQLARLTGNTTGASLKVVLPKNKGNIIGIGISNGGGFVIDLVTTTVTIKANGITIIENVQAVNFNALSTRDYFLNKVWLSPGTELEMILNVVTLSGIAAPAVSDVYHDFTILFES